MRYSKSIYEYGTISIITFFSIGVVNVYGCTSYVYALIIFCLINFSLDKRYQQRNFYAFNFYIILSLVVYFINLQQFPGQLGLTGGKETQTDDAYYYMSATDNPNVNISFLAEADDEEFYAKVFRFIYPFKIVDPINIIVLNVLLGLSFLPYFTAKTAEVLFQSKKIADLAYKLISLCPFCLMNGVVILRDVPGALLIIASFYYYLSKKYLILSTLVLLLFFLKFGFVVFLVGAILCGVFLKNRIGINCTTITIVGLLGMLFVVVTKYVLPELGEITDGRLEDGNIFRLGYIDFILESNPNSFFAKIYAYPELMRVPLLILSFIFLPLQESILGYNSATQMITPRLFIGSFTPVYMLIWFRYFFGCIKNYFKIDRSAKIIFMIVLVEAFLLGAISLQMRHRVVLMPFLYILIAYGFFKVKCGTFSTAMQVCYFLINMFYLIIKF